jgi:non-specific protein-tyrosine kinase
VLLRQQLGIVLARLPLLLASVALAGASAFFFSTLQPKVYQSEATLIVGQSLSAVNPDYNQLLVSQRLSSTYATVATTRPILTKVIDRLGLDTTPDQLARDVSASAATDGALLTIEARDNSPARAAQIANAVAEELIAATPSVQGGQAVDSSVEQDLAAIRKDISDTQAEIDALVAVPERTPSQDARLDTLRGRVVSLRSTYATLLGYAPESAANLMTIIQPAVAGDAPVAPRPLLNALLAAVVAFMIVSAGVFVVEYLDDAIKGPDEVEEALGLPTLGTIERMAGARERLPIYRLATLLYPRSGAAEAYRALRTNVEFAAIDEPIHRLLVTSAVPSEGKTVTAANLAVAFAQGGRRILLVDADLRRPGVHEIFAIDNETGLTNLLRHDETRLGTLVRQSEQKNLSILPAGPLPPNPAELLGSHRMRTLMSTLTEGYDMVIFDSPPIEAFTDAAVLSSLVDGTLLVVESRRGRLAQIRSARESLTRANARLLGVVLNGLQPKAPSEYGRYYGTGPEREAATQAAAPATDTGRVEPR